MGVRAMKTKQRLGWGTGVGGVLALAIGGLAACGSDFASDCRATRTCPATDDSQGGDNAGGALDGIAGSQTGGGGAGAAGGDAVGGDAGNDAAAGAGGQSDCHLANNCVNPPPTVVAIAPADEATGIEPDAKIVITLSEPLDEETVSAVEDLNVDVGDGLFIERLTQRDHDLGVGLDARCLIGWSYRNDGRWRVHAIVR